ncbi:MAG TPA: hypothetical protein H9819_00610 [Candidatus Bacteroides merdipullorum]|uniref:Uncharacterized protein n=1 Tax=Candidatus Bacteroides merdipullorum TaxID=2838474 RepID=A0A9D2CVU8_9BACE|nr:hypothetical protein [Candidatus Bacteroides merdipullorum]
MHGRARSSGQEGRLLCARATPVTHSRQSVVEPMPRIALRLKRMLEQLPLPGE